MIQLAKVQNKPDENELGSITQLAHKIGAITGTCDASLRDSSFIRKCFASSLMASDSRGGVTLALWPHKVGIRKGKCALHDGFIR